MTNSKSTDCVVSLNHTIIQINALELFGENLTIQDVRSLVRLLSRQKVESGLLVLLNLTGVQVIGDSKITHYLINQQSNINNLSKMALLVNTDVNRLLGHFVSMVMTNEHKIAVFDDYERAQSWLLADLPKQ